jgi:hypothetical protein
MSINQFISITSPGSEHVLYQFKYPMIPNSKSTMTMYSTSSKLSSDHIVGACHIPLISGAIRLSLGDPESPNAMLEDLKPTSALSLCKYASTIKLDHMDAPLELQWKRTHSVDKQYHAWAYSHLKLIDPKTGIVYARFSSNTWNAFNLGDIDILQDLGGELGDRFVILSVTAILTRIMNTSPFMFPIY